MGPVPPILSDFASGVKGADLRNGLVSVPPQPRFLHLLRFTQKLLEAIRGLGKHHPNLQPFPHQLFGNVYWSVVCRAGEGAHQVVHLRPSDPGVVALQHPGTNLDVKGEHSSNRLLATY